MIFDENRMSTDDVKKFQKIFYENRKPLTRYIDKLSRRHKKDIFWWILPTVSRNNNLSSFIPSVCLCLLLKIKIDKNEVDVIVVKKKSVALADFYQYKESHSGIVQECS